MVEISFSVGGDSLGGGVGEGRERGTGLWDEEGGGNISRNEGAGIGIVGGAGSLDKGLCERGGGEARPGKGSAFGEEGARACGKGEGTPANEVSLLRGKKGDGMPEIDRSGCCEGPDGWERLAFKGGREPWTFG